MKYFAISIMVLLSLDVLSDETDKFIGSVPKSIYESMKLNNCEPITNFYEDYFVEHPPFINYDNGSSIFVCQYEKQKNVIGYKLVFKINDSNEYNAFKDCPSVIESENKFGGLVVSEEFHNFDGKNKKYLTLTIGKDGGFNTYVCFNSNWRIGAYH